MHRALLLPEVVISIVRAGKTEPGLLYSCLFVNKLFSLEACRILWKGCYGIFGVGHVTPKISDLGKMVLSPDAGIERAQFYANFVRVLVFQEDEFSGEDDARWHPQLCRLHFPLLEDLNIWKTKLAEEFNTEDAILHYVHPGLRDLRVDASGSLSDSFLRELSRSCPRLQQLDIDFKNVTFSDAGLAHFFREMKSLQGIHVAALDKSWSPESFVAIAEYEQLKLLHIPTVHNTWFDLLDPPSKPVLFPALRYFYSLDTTGTALRRLFKLNPSLEALHIYNSSLPGPEDVLSAAAQFSELKNFRYQPGPSAHINGVNLLALAQSCHSLISLSIGQDQSDIPAGIDISQSTIQNLAQALPSLKELYLVFQSTSPPGIASILSAFSQHCPMLTTLDISCGSDWNSITILPKEVLLPNLWTISLRPKLHMEETLTESQFKHLFKHFQEAAPMWFPKIEYFNIDDADDWEQAFDDYMYHVGCEREYGIAPQSSEVDVDLDPQDNDAGRSASHPTGHIQRLYLSDEVHPESMI